MRLARLIAGLMALELAASGTALVLAAPPAGADRHWAFSPVKRPDPPTQEGAANSRNPIDRFINSKLDTEGIERTPATDRRTLIRRITFDLIGLPPTPEEIHAFLADASPDAIEKVVDRLMARPQYGERWARHWLDVVRYAESNGYERDGGKPSAWRYRDYVINAFNNDKPYDRFLTEQLAGDELPDSNAESQIATTFLRLGTWDDEPADPLVDRYDQLDDVLGTMSSAILGVTLRCARCHDHKFEPFSQVDYYRMLSVFEPLKRPQINRDEFDREVGTQATLKAYREAKARCESDFQQAWGRIEGLAKPELERMLAPGPPGKDGKPKRSTFPLPKETITALRVEASKRTKEQWDAIRQDSNRIIQHLRTIAPGEVKKSLGLLDDRLKVIATSAPTELPRAYIWYEESPRAPETHLLKRGDPTKPGETLGPGVPAIMVARQPEPPRATEHSSGRRLWLAKWLTSPENPLAARVIVNRIWQFHFGEGLVPTSNDFGVMGEEPSHPELLDWLAAEFVASGWKIKSLNRMIILSEAYQRSSRSIAESAKVDPKGTLLWRWRQHRFEAEVVRDSILAVSGRLNPKMGGTSFYPTLPREVLEGQSKPGDGWGSSGDSEQARRSIYIFAKRSLGVPELELLDSPDTTGSCERRTVSTTGPQALTFLNGAFIHDQARFFAARLIDEAGTSPEAQVQRAFALALSRPPTDDEQRAAISFLNRQTRQIEADSKQANVNISQADASREALKSFCLAVLNMNEFVHSN